MESGRGRVNMKRDPAKMLPAYVSDWTEPKNSSHRITLNPKVCVSFIPFLTSLGRRPLVHVVLFLFRLLGLQLETSPEEANPTLSKHFTDLQAANLSPTIRPREPLKLAAPPNLRQQHSLPRRVATLRRTQQY
jgi:hypothetical protein